MPDALYVNRQDCIPLGALAAQFREAPAVRMASVARRAICSAWQMVSTPYR